MMNLFKKREKETPELDCPQIWYPPIFYYDVTIYWTTRVEECFKDCRVFLETNCIQLIMPNEEEKIIPYATIEMISRTMVRKEDGYKE